MAGPLPMKSCTFHEVTMEVRAGVRETKYVCKEHGTEQSFATEFCDHVKDRLIRENHDLQKLRMERDRMRHELLVQQYMQAQVTPPSSADEIQQRMNEVYRQMQAQQAQQAQQAPSGGQYYPSWQNVPWPPNYVANFEKAVREVANRKPYETICDWTDRCDDGKLSDVRVRKDNASGHYTITIAEEREDDPNWSSTLKGHQYFIPSAKECDKELRALESKNGIRVPEKAFPVVLPKEERESIERVLEKAKDRLLADAGDPLKRNVAAPNGVYNFLKDKIGRIFG